MIRRAVLTNLIAWVRHYQGDPRDTAACVLAIGMLLKGTDIGGEHTKAPT